MRGKKAHHPQRRKGWTVSRRLSSLDLASCGLVLILCDYRTRAQRPLTVGVPVQD